MLDGCARSYLITNTIGATLSPARAELRISSRGRAALRPRPGVTRPFHGADGPPGLHRDKGRTQQRGRQEEEDDDETTMGRWWRRPRGRWRRRGESDAAVSGPCDDLLETVASSQRNCQRPPRRKLSGNQSVPSVDTFRAVVSPDGHRWEYVDEVGEEEEEEEEEGKEDAEAGAAGTPRCPTRGPCDRFAWRRGASLRRSVSGCCVTRSRGAIERSKWLMYQNASGRSACRRISMGVHRRQ